MYQKPLRKRKSGFTLIELLVVIAIIAILAAILFPVFVRIKRNAQSTFCQSNLKQLAIASALYAENNDGRYPVQITDGIMDWNSPTAAPNWAKALEKYIKNARIPACPSSPKLSDCKTNCSMIMTSASYPISYIGNGKIFSASIKESAIKRSAKTLLFQCGGRTWNRCWLAPSKDEEYDVWISYTSRSWINHNNGTNIAFVDTHIEWQSYEKLSNNLSVFDP